VLELDRGGAGDGIQGFAGGVRDQMQVDARVGHGGKNSGDSGDYHHIVTIDLGKAGIGTTRRGTVEECAAVIVEMGKRSKNTMESSRSMGMLAWITG
jgi:hypothetical protein